MRKAIISSYDMDSEYKDFKKVYESLIANRVSFSDLKEAIIGGGIGLGFEFPHEKRNRVWSEKTNHINYYLFHDNIVLDDLIHNLTDNLVIPHSAHLFVEFNHVEKERKKFKGLFGFLGFGEFVSSEITKSESLVYTFSEHKLNKETGLTQFSSFNRGDHFMLLTKKTYAQVNNLFKQVHDYNT